MNSSPASTLWEAAEAETNKDNNKDNRTRPLMPKYNHASRKAGAEDTRYCREIRSLLSLLQF